MTQQPKPPRLDPAPTDSAPSLLDEVLASTPKRAEPPTGPLLGEVLDTHNPYLRGRVWVRWDEGSGPVDAWLRVVEGARIRTGAQVLLTRPANASEWLVTASLVGPSSPAPSSEPDSPEVLHLEPGQVVRIEDHRGQPLLEIHADEAGPQLRLLGRDATFATEGTLRLEAGRIELRSHEGADLRSEGDVLVRGRVIRLN